MSWQTLTMATSFKLQVLTGVRVDLQYSLKVLLLCLHTQKSWKFAVSGPSVSPFSPHLISCLSIFCHHSYVNYHAIIPSITHSNNFDRLFSLQSNPLCTISPRFFVMLKNQKLICPTSSLVVQSLFFFDNLNLNIDLLPSGIFLISFTHPDWLRTHHASMPSSISGLSIARTLLLAYPMS